MIPSVGLCKKIGNEFHKSIITPIRCKVKITDVEYENDKKKIYIYTRSKNSWFKIYYLMNNIDIIRLVYDLKFGVKLIIALYGLGSAEDYDVLFKEKANDLFKFKKSKKAISL